MSFVQLCDHSTLGALGGEPPFVCCPGDPGLSLNAGALRRLTADCSCAPRLLELWPRHALRSYAPGELRASRLRRPSTAPDGSILCTAGHMA